MYKHMHCIGDFLNRFLLVVEVKLPEGGGSEPAEGEGKCWC